MKKLYVIRHGKSDWGNPEVNDFNRPLNHRGIKDAPKIGKYLLENHDHPDLILSSPAKRAFTTAKLIADQLDYSESKILINEQIYLAGLEILLQIINSIDDQFDCVYIFGHNPGFSNLASYLTDNWIEMKTCCVASLESDVDSWKHWSKGLAILKTHISPRNLKVS